MPPAQPEGRTPSPEPDLLTPQEVARRLDVDTKTLSRLVREGRFPRPVRITRRMHRWRPWQWDRYLEALDRFGEYRDTAEPARKRRRGKGKKGTQADTEGSEGKPRDK